MAFDIIEGKGIKRFPFCAIYLAKMDRQWMEG